MGRFFKFNYFKDNGITNHVHGDYHFGNCVLCGCYGMLHGHHVITRSKGGTEEDIVGVCFSCHRWIHDNPSLAAKRGLYLKEYKNEKGTTKTTTD